jgi:hypothetical protein
MIVSPKYNAVRPIRAVMGLRVSPNSKRTNQTGNVYGDSGGADVCQHCVSNQFRQVRVVSQPIHQINAKPAVNLKKTHQVIILSQLFGFDAPFRAK